MRVVGLALIVCLGAVPAAAQPTNIGFDDRPDLVTATIEVETASNGIVPCGSVTVVGAERRCSATFSRTAAQSIRLRVSTADGTSDWSASLMAPAVPPGSTTAAYTITFAAPLPPVPPPVSYTLTVATAGSGSGTVTSAPAGIACGTTCSAPYVDGTSVTLTAAPASGSTFAGWTGACSGTGSCVLAMTQARAVTATFAIVTTPTLWTYRAGSFVSAGNGYGGALALNRPAGVVNGDLVVVAVYFEPDTPALSITGGFTTAATCPNTGAFKLQVFTKIAASEPASYTITSGASGNQWRAAAAVAYAGGSGVTPLVDVTGCSQADNAGETAQTAPSITTTGPDRLVLFVYGNYTGNNAGATTGFATRHRGVFGGIVLADAVQAVAGATGTTRPASGSGVGGAETYAAMHVAFRSY